MPEKGRVGSFRILNQNVVKETKVSCKEQDFAHQDSKTKRKRPETWSDYALQGEGKG